MTPKRLILFLLISTVALPFAWAQEEETNEADIVAEPLAAGPEGQDETVAEAEPAAESKGAIDLFARDSYRIDTLVCPFKGKIDYEPGDIECFLLEVPENREIPDSRMIELMFVRLNARWGRLEDFEDDRDQDALKFAEGLGIGKREDPIIYLSGGPGAPANYYVNRFKDHTILDYRDLYILEQRGINNSGEVCPKFDSRSPETQDVHTWEESLESGNIARSNCAVNARARGVDLNAYNTRENARDVRALRMALGLDDWNVWGISYGSVLGQAYIKEDPEGIRAVALDAIMPLDIQADSESWRVVKWYVRDLEKLQEICQRQEACARAYPDIPGRLRQVTRSIAANPITVEVKDTELFPSGKVTIFQDFVAILPFGLLYEQSNYPVLPGLIYAWADALERRDEALFKTLASASGDDFGGVSSGMYMAIVCNDGHQHAQGQASLKDLQEFPLLGQVLGNERSIARDSELCSNLGMFTRPASDYTAVETDIPTLLIEGEMDPITPPPNAKVILPGFSNGTYVEFPFAGHGPSRSEQCAGHMLNRFYDDPAAEPDMSCPQSMEEPEFWAPMYTTTIAPKLGSIFFEDKKRLIVPGVWAGLSILISILAFLSLTIAPVGRWLNSSRAGGSGLSRLWAWLASACAAGAIGVLGVAVAATMETSELAIMFGLVPWALYGAWLGVAAGVAGLLAIITAVRARRNRLIASGTMLGFFLTGAAAVGLSSFMLVWGLGPF